MFFSNLTALAKCYDMHPVLDYGDAVNKMFDEVRTLLCTCNGALTEYYFSCMHYDSAVYFFCH